MNKATVSPWLSAIVDSATDAVIVIDKDRAIRFANLAAARLAEVSSAENLLGVSYDEIVKRSRILDEAGTIASYDSFPSTIALTKGIETRDILFEQVYKERHRWLRISAHPLFDEEGAPEYAIVRFADISEQKLKEDRLKMMVASARILSVTTDSNTKLIEKARLIVPLLADWCTVNIKKSDGTLSRIAVFHRDPGKENLVTRLAMLSEDELGASRGIRKVIETGLPEFYPVVTLEVQDIPSISSERQSLMQDLGVCSSMILPIVSQGDILGAISLAYSQSGRHYSEDDLEFMQEFCLHLGLLADNTRLYDEIKDRDRAKDTFIASLSHELRNPLAPIKSSLELMQLKNTNEEFEAELLIVGRQFEHLTKLLNDLLDVTRYSQGKIHLEQERTDLTELIHTIVRSYEPLIAKNGIELKVDIPEESIFLWADRVRLEQMIMNILDNAQKFTPQDGCITIDVHEVDSVACISIRDTGEGIEKSELGKIFELHFQGNNPSQSQHSGLGIGLVLVREIAQLHGGNVEARSDGMGEGSEFVITLPLYRPEVT